MGIDSESDVAATLVIGPTSEGRVRLYVEAEGIELPMDFDPAEAREIAAELETAATAAERSGGGRAGGGSGKARRSGAAGA